ncbi:heparan-alpha-glucosaminide N-acetyltransferase isoform X1 [Oncorhynchus keta]|uniref:heparan-alpha-glucosaminide N-acetyltransferase isoform X1 n=1 Tax=Oncorhynchus keta TaxID=8018 RepID=UPI0015FB240E|nr:heparan-alpha-glucosaminide N-acetyltransferase isoform X1 [Oncorhynchus keta]
MEPRRILTQILCVFFLTTGRNEGKLDAKSCSGRPALKLDQACLTFHNQLPTGVDVLYTSDYCYKCLYQPLVSVPNGPQNASVVVSTVLTLTLQLQPMGRNTTLCRWSQLYEEAAHYSVWIQESESPINVICYQTVDVSPSNIYFPLLVAALLLALISLLCVLVPYLYRRRCTTKLIKTICHEGPRHAMDDETQGCGDEVNTAQPKPTRLRSLDTFRGLSLTIMVFVNYGGGGYWIFEHAPWNGLTVADLVMPWFVFILGTSVVLAFTSMQKKGVSRRQLIRKLTWRTVVLILIGFCFINYSPKDGLLSWSWLRIPGVLQRLGFTYFILSLMQTFCGMREIPLSRDRWWDPVQDVVLYWPEWIFIILLETLWLCLTFLLPVPNCPTGYLGAGGIGDNGLYPNCTGGAAGYIDKWLLGDNIYHWPTCKAMYRTTQPFDPEGVLGTINSIVMGFMGMQAGKILIFYRKKDISVLSRFLVWAILLGNSAAVLSKCTRDEGFIPVNKNLWSLSYITCMGCFSFLLLGVMYFVMDIKGWWGGQPFIYPGMNSIFVYVGHSLLGSYFPFSWEMRFVDSHWEKLFQSLWATSLWVLIAFLLYRKKFFLKV